jgi:hypothetical protein
MCTLLQTKALAGQLQGTVACLQNMAGSSSYTCNGVVERWYRECPKYKGGWSWVSLPSVLLAEPSWRPESCRAAKCLAAGVKSPPFLPVGYSSLHTGGLARDQGGGLWV